MPPIIRSGVHNKNRGTRLHKLWETDIHIIRLHVQMYQQTGMCKAHRKGGIQIRIQEAPLQSGMCDTHFCQPIQSVASREKSSFLCSIYFINDQSEADLSISARRGQSDRP